MTEFAISSRTETIDGNTIKVVSVSGALDAHTFPRLQHELEDHFKSDSTSLVIDCEKLDYISSAGLGVLKKMVKEFRGKGGDIRLAQLSKKIDTIINLLGFSQIIKVFGTLDDAVASYSEK